MFAGPGTPKARSIRTAPSTTPVVPVPSYLLDTVQSNTPSGPPPGGRSAFNSSYNPGKKNAGYGVPDESEYYEDEDEDVEAEDDDLFGRQSLLSSRGPAHSLRSSIGASQSRGIKRDRGGQPKETLEKKHGPVMRFNTRGKKAAQLKEPDHVILESERIVDDVNARIQRQPGQRDALLADAASQLTKLWSKASKSATKPGGIGPESSDGLTKANYLASLLLQLYYPHSTKATPATRNPRSLTTTEQAPTAVPVPKALLEWLETYHVPFPDDYDYVRDYNPAPSAQESFWDVVLANILRGKLGRAVGLLKDAGWEHAYTAEEDHAYEGYNDQQLEYIDEAVDDCVRVLEACPGHKYDDWDVRSLDWTTYRQRANAMFEKLVVLAEGDGEQEGNMFERSVRGGGQSLSSSVRKAESKVPYTIYDNLKVVYGILLGCTEEILMTAQDWLEGSLYLTIWWDGTSEEDMGASLSRSSMRRSAIQSDRLVDGFPLDAYRRRLARAFDDITKDVEEPNKNEKKDPVFEVDTLDSIQLGLGCVLEGSVTEAVELLRTWSMPITVSVAELGTLGRWIPCARPRSRGGFEFSRDNLLGMSAPGAPPPDDLDLDELLSEYADLLSAKREVRIFESCRTVHTDTSRLMRKKAGSSQSRC